MSLSHTPGPALAWMLQVECPAPCLVFQAVRAADGRLLDFRWSFLNPAAERFVRELSLGPSTSLWTDDSGPLLDFDACARVVASGATHRSEFRCQRNGALAS